MDDGRSGRSTIATNGAPGQTGRAFVMRQAQAVPPSPKPRQGPELTGKARRGLYDGPPLRVSRAEQEAARPPCGR